MPDWAVHLAAGAAFGKTFRLRNLHVLLLGSVLPDIAAGLSILAEYNFLPVDPYFIVSLTVPIGSPFGAACLSLILACWMTRPLAAFGLLFLGALLHYLLDILQTCHVEFLLYPWSFEIVNAPLFSYAHPFFSWLSLIALAGLIVLRFFPMPRDIHCSAQYAWLSVLPLLLLALVIAVNAPRLLPENKFNLRFLLGEPLPENTPVKIYAAQVLESQPLVVKKLRRQIGVTWPRAAAPQAAATGSIAKGRLVYIEGRFSNNRIAAESIIPLANGRKTIFSLLGLFLLIIYWLKIPLLDDKAHA